GQNSHKIIEYFQAIHGVQEIKEKYNPCDMDARSELNGYRS
ncbi:unnamed protein product, partial [Brassica oleracea]